MNGIFFYPKFRTMKYWIIKSEPNKYSWEQMQKDGTTFWDGIRNYTARLNLRDMQVGDICLFYHSNIGLELVSITKVIRTAYQDPTTDDDRWVAVDIKVVKSLKNPVTLREMKAEKSFQNMDLIRISRLSVGKVSEAEYLEIIKMSER